MIKYIFLTKLTNQLKYLLNVTLKCNRTEYTSNFKASLYYIDDLFCRYQQIYAERATRVNDPGSRLSPRKPHNNTCTREVVNDNTEKSEHLSSRDLPSWMTQKKKAGSLTTSMVTETNKKKKIRYFTSMNHKGLVVRFFQHPSSIVLQLCII